LGHPRRSRNQLLRFKTCRNFDNWLGSIRIAPRSGGVSDCESAKAASATSFARFYFATTFAIKDQCLWQSRQGGDPEL